MDFLFFIVITYLLLDIFWHIITTNAALPIDGLIAADERTEKCPHGHRVRDGEHVAFSAPIPSALGGDGQRPWEFELRVGPCSHCGAHVVRATRSEPTDLYFKEWRAAYALKCAPKEVLKRLRHIVREARRHGRLQKRRHTDAR